MAAKKKKVKALSESFEDPTRLPDVEKIGADTEGSGSLESNAPVSRLNAFSTPRTADEIPALTDKVAETRKKAEAARQREIRANTKLESHLNIMEELRTGKRAAAWSIPDSPSIRVMNSKIALGRLNETDDSDVVKATQKVAEKRGNLAAKRLGGVSNQEVADALNTKSYLKKRVIDPETGKKVPVAPHTAESVSDNLAARSIAQNRRPSSSIEQHLRDQIKSVGVERQSALTEHLVAKSHLDEAKGDLETIQQQAASAKAEGAAREAAENAPEVDAATGLPYGSKNTIVRGKSKTDPSVETVGEDTRKVKQIGFTNADVADLTRAVAPLRSAVLQGGGNVKFPTHTQNKAGDTLEIPVEKKSPVSTNAVDSMLESVRTSHSAVVHGHAQNGLAHIRDAHETLLTLKALVPHGSVVRTAGGDVDLHKALDSAITAHATAHQAIVRRVVQRDKTIKSNLPSLTDVKKRLGSVISTNKGGRKVFDISDSAGSAVTGSRARKLADIAGLTANEGNPGENIPESARRDVIDYAANKGPEMGDRESSQTEKEIQAYARKVDRNEEFRRSMYQGGGVGSAQGL
jgi:hypothetical protein